MTIVYNAKIDTTFKLQARNTNFTRIEGSYLRAGPPYSARHTNWYIDKNRLTPEEMAYGNKSANWAKP